MGDGSPPDQFLKRVSAVHQRVLLQLSRSNVAGDSDNPYQVPGGIDDR
jgi:hypothetical protein